MSTRLSVLASIMMAFLLNGYALAHAGLSATETVNGAITRVFDILSDPARHQPGIASQHRTAIENVLRNNLSHEDMARRSMGMAWIRLSESEQQHFHALFIQVLRDAIACRLNEYSQTQIIYLSEQLEGKFAQVRTLLKGSKVDTFGDVHLVNRSGQWLMYDAVIDGVHLIDNYRAQFGQVMRDDSYAGLVKKIEAKTLDAKNFDQ